MKTVFILERSFLHDGYIDGLFGIHVPGVYKIHACHSAYLHWVLHEKQVFDVQCKYYCNVV